MLNLFLSFCFLFFSFLAFGGTKAPVSWSGNQYKIINQYTKLHKEFFRKTCSPKEDANYFTLLKNYRGQGYYLPKVEGKIDRLAIINNFHHFKKKLDFIESTIKRLKKTDYPKFDLIHFELDKIVENLLNLKKEHYLAISNERKEAIRKESAAQLVRLKKQFKIFIDQIFFLKSYNFPNDYLSYRKTYEDYKNKEGVKAKRMANKTFFLRKILEDGAYDPNKTRPDKFLRTTMDTLYLSIMKMEDFISENVRYDLEWVERQLDRVLRRGKKVQLSRLREWRDRTKENMKFYSDLIEIKNKNKAAFLIKKENDATIKLKEFVYKKQAEVYEFWSKQSELMKALFTLETILVHEVGVIDGEHGLERMAVSQVVMNRYYDDFYSTLDKDQMLVKFLDPQIDQSKNKWLNVLFRIGEFSFTYHYISAVAGIHCPDMSRRGRGIRKKNLKIALKAIKTYDGSFNAYRYFSRISMLGKIDMSTVWTGYQRLPELLGYKVSRQKKLISHYLADKYQYLYSFVDARGFKFTVVRIKKKTYSVTWEKGHPVFYDYRNPHLFAYFSKRPN